MKKSILPNLIMTILIVMSLFVTSLCVYAAPDGGCSITAEFVTERGFIPGSEFKIYRAMTIDGELTGDFAGYDIEIGDLSDSEALGELGDTLAAYALRDNIAPLNSKYTDTLGEAAFSGLDNGIYLLCGTSVVVGNVLYIPKPSLVRVPYVSENGETVTNVALEVKFDRRELSAETIERTVVKVWDDNGNINRPTEVTVQLIRSGEIFDTVTLNEQCGWKYTWTGLDPGFDWQVTEAEVPANYRVSITLDETVFTVTNRFRQNSSGDDDTGSSTSTAQTVLAGNNTATTTVTAATAVTTSKPLSPPTLPQTGQLWWPVPIMLIVGALLLLVGIIDRNLE